MATDCSDRAQCRGISRHICYASTRDLIDYAEAQQWTDYLTLEPLRLVQNIFGGGDVQRNRLAISDLEVRAADLVRRREAVAESLARDVVGAGLVGSGV